jgi:HlyD family secretion protein
MTRKGWIVAAVLAVLAAGGYYAWTALSGSGLPAGIASGNGRIEAVEIDISSKIAGRIAEIFVNEGDFVEAGQELARMDTAQLVARRRQAEAELARAKVGVETADSLVRQQQAQLEAASALIEQREAELNAAETRRDRSEQLRKSNTVSQQVLDDDRAN